MTDDCDEAQTKTNAANSIFSNPNPELCRVYAVKTKKILLINSCNLQIMIIYKLKHNLFDFE